MKNLFFGLCLLVCSCAAQALSLVPETCNTPGAWCYHVDGSDGLLVYSPQYGRINYYPGDGTDYDSGLYAVPAGSRSFVATLISPEGRWKEISVVFTTYETCNRTGRGQGCVTHWVLQSGIIE